MPMIRFMPLAALLGLATAAAAQPSAAPLLREVWVADEAPGTPQRTLTLALRDALATTTAIARPRHRHRTPHVPPVVASAPAPRILYLADDVRLDRRHRRFRYTALLTDRGFRTTTAITGRCRVDRVAACARGIVARLPA